MQPDLQVLQSDVDQILRLVQVPFWRQFDFWIGITIGIGGLIFSILAFLEARKAKRAATEAGRTVKLQTVTIELTEVSQKLDRIQPEIHFNEARDLLAEISRRVRRAVSPFAHDSGLSDAITAVLAALATAQSSIRKVRPSDPTKEVEAPYTVYYGIEGDFAVINNCVADLIGLFEKKTLDFGDDDAGS